MKAYQLEIKQSLDYPRCRIYREFVHSLISDRSLHVGNTSHLFHYTVLCCYANFRTSYLRIDGTSYIIRPGEWVCRITDLVTWFRVRFQHQVLSILSELQKLHLIAYTEIGHSHLVKYRIIAWRRYNTVLDYNCPCQKETGFFFMPISIASKLINTCPRASEMDIVLDLWLSTVYRDKNVPGSELGPIVYYRKWTGSPLISFSDLSKRWGRSRSSVGRLLKKLAAQGYLTLISFPGRNGSVIYLNSYLSTMFQVADVTVKREDVAISLHIKIRVPAPRAASGAAVGSTSVHVPDFIVSVPKWHIQSLVKEISQAIESQGFACLQTGQFIYMLSPLSIDCMVSEMPPGRAHQMLRFEVVLSHSAHESHGVFPSKEFAQMNDC